MLNIVIQMAKPALLAYELIHAEYLLYTMNK